MKKLLLHLLLLPLFGSQVFAGSIDGGEQTELPAVDDSVYMLDINYFSMPFNDRGALASVDVDGEDPGGRLNDKIFLYSAGFYLSGYYNDSLWSNGVAPSSFLNDYLPGNTSTSPDDPRTHLYIIKAGDEPFGQSWQDWADAVDLGAYYYDGDGDGQYNPVDLNNNGIWDKDEDSPDLLADETIWCVYHDGMPSDFRQYSNVEPMGIDIRQTVYAYDSLYGEFGNVIFIRYSILNTGTVSDTFNNVIFSFWADPDIGDGEGVYDDLAGCDTLRNSGYAYNDGDDPYWGNNPPCFMQTIVQGPPVYTGNATDTAFNYRGERSGLFIRQGYKNGGLGAYTDYVNSHPTHGSPRSKEECRYRQEGRQKDGSPYDPCSWQFGRVVGANCADVTPYYLYSGDPFSQTGWLADSPDEIKTVTSTDKFQLTAGTPVDIIVAYIVGFGPNAIESLVMAKYSADLVQERYRENINNATLVDIEDEQIPDNVTLYRNYPNPFNPSTTITFDINVTSEVSLIVYDMLGREVASLVDGTLSAGAHEVEFTAADLPSGVYFYRLKTGNFMESKKMLLLK